MTTALGNGAEFVAPPNLRRPAQEPDFASHCILVPPLGIRSRRHKADDQRTLSRRQEGFSHPSLDLTSVRWIHPTDTVPRLGQTIVLHCEVTLAFGILGGGAYIQIESEFGVEPIEQELGSIPVVPFRHEMDRLRCCGGLALNGRRRVVATVAKPTALSSLSICL